jgi:hypothetical protein
LIREQLCEEGFAAKSLSFQAGFQPPVFSLLPLDWHLVKSILLDQPGQLLVVYMV